MKIFDCRLCQNKLSSPKLIFPPTPLANEFVKDISPQEIFPLEICVCQSCEHYQLDEHIDPDRLFKNYLYVAGTSPVNVEHFRQYAIHMAKTFNLQPGDKVLDIASNDGTLLKQFLDLKMSILGIDPARNIVEEANKNGIPTIPDFFTEELANEMLLKYGKFNLITANNVFAHVPDLADFAKGVKKLLKPDGIFSFEVSYFVDVCDKLAFDTIYHEHSSYHTIGPLVKFFDYLDMKLFGVERLSNHGGSIRVFVSHKTNTNEKYYNSSDGSSWYSLHNMLSTELDMNEKIIRLQKNIELLKHNLKIKLQNFKNQGKSIAIYGVPAKATTLIYALKIDETWIDFAVDDAPLKQGTYTPGKHIPVLPTEAIYEKNPDVLLILAWNFADSIIKKHHNFKGTWIIPIPKIREYNG